MMHKSEDYKISAVKYYLKNKDNIRKTCKKFVDMCICCCSDIREKIKNVKDTKITCG